MLHSTTSSKEKNLSASQKVRDLVSDFDVNELEQSVGSGGSGF